MATDIIPKQVVYELSDGPRLNHDDELKNDVYAFGLALAEGSYHVQRWLILTRDPARRPPTRTMVLKPTQHPSWKDETTLERFVQKARESFRAPAPGRSGSFYAKVNCERRLGTAHPTLPRPMPRVEGPGQPTGQFQPDIGTAHLFVAPNITKGYLHTLRNGVGRTIEHWILLDGYSPETAPTTLGRIDSPEKFADVMDRTTWNERATLVTCGCSYFTAVPPGNEA